MGEVVSYTKAGIEALIADAISNAGGVDQADIDAAVAALVDSAPGALDTLNELAAAMGDDPNFATTITNLVATKADSADLTAHIADTTNIHGIDNTNYLMRVMAHGADPNAARPAGGTDIVVHWIGTADPVNAGENDLWTNA